MIDMIALQSIVDVLKAQLGLECFHRACITTYEMAPPRRNGTALFEGQTYHVEGQATHDFLYFRHPTLNVMVLVTCVWNNFSGEGREYVSLEISGSTDEWITPGGDRTLRDADGYPVYEDPNPPPWDEPKRVPVPDMPHGFRAHGGVTGGGGPCQRSYEGALVPADTLADVIKHIFNEHFNLEPISEDPFENYQLTSFMPHYCWKETQEAFYKRFPQNRIKDLALQFFGGEP